MRMFLVRSVVGISWYGFLLVRYVVRIIHTDPDFFCGPVHGPIFLKMFGPGGHGSEYILYVSKEDFRLYVFELLYIQSLKAKEISSEVSRIKTAFYKLMIGYSNSNTPTLVKLVPLALLFIPIK